MNYEFNKHYLERYVRFIRSREPSNGYVERHHIYPRSMFPQLKNDPANLIALTAREHFIAHWMLHKAFGGKMTQAFMYMKSYCNDHSRYWNLNSHAYENLRSEFSVAMSGAKLGKALSEETKRKMSESRIGKRLAKSHIEAIRIGNVGKYVSDDTRRKISESKAGKTPNRVVTDSYRALMKRPKKKVACSCCGQMVSVNMVNRWHNENCKHKLLESA